MSQEQQEIKIETPFLPPKGVFDGLQKSIRIVPPKMIIWGRNGIGKSTFASYAPDPIFIDLEQNTNEISCVRHDDTGFNINNYLDLIKFMDLLIKEPHSFKTLVIDSATKVQNLIDAQIYEEGSQNKNFKFAKYEQIVPKWDLLLKRLQWLWLHKHKEEKKDTVGMNIIIIGHPKTEKKPGTTALGEEVYQYELAIDKRALAPLQSWCNCMLFFADEPTFEEENKEFGKKVKELKKSSLHKRVIYTNFGTLFTAKNTYQLPEKLDFRCGKSAWEEFHNRRIDFYNLNSGDIK